MTSCAPQEVPQRDDRVLRRLIEIYLLQCGHGDTILIRLPDDRWGLIDCYLPEQYGIRSRFFRFIEEKKIKTFEFIFQTHPDRDHYHGMQAVIEHFLGRGEKIEYYIDTGLNARVLDTLLQGWPVPSAEYELLQDKLEEWDESGQIQWFELTARSMSFVPRGYHDQIEFVPIGPDPGEKRRIMTSDLRKPGTKPKTRPEANELSLVVVLAVKISDRTLNVLLGADAGVESLGRALDYWSSTLKSRARRRFRCDQGSSSRLDQSHVPALCQRKRPGTGAGRLPPSPRGPGGLLPRPRASATTL